MTRKQSKKQAEQFVHRCATAVSEPPVAGSATGSDAILKRLRFSGVEDYELDPGVCKAAANEIERLREWIKAEGERTDQCTYTILGEICDGCRCERKHPNEKLTNTAVE